MTWLLLAVQLFAFPVTSAYAVQSKQDVMVGVTYTTAKPAQVCTEAFALQDVEMLSPTDAHCWTPETNIGDVDVWKDTNINYVNFRVTVRYPDGMVVVINLTTVLNT